MKCRTGLKRHTWERLAACGLRKLTLWVRAETASWILLWARSHEWRGARPWFVSEFSIAWSKCFPPQVICLAVACDDSNWEQQISHTWKRGHVRVTGNKHLKSPLTLSWELRFKYCKVEMRHRHRRKKFITYAALHDPLQGAWLLHVERVYLWVQRAAPRSWPSSQEQSRNKSNTDTKPSLLCYTRSRDCFLSTHIFFFTLKLTLPKW